MDSVGAEPELRTSPDPELADGQGEPEAGSSLVRVHAAVLGHLDLQLIRGEVAMTPTLPLVPGSEGAGVVIASAAITPGTPVRIRGGGAGIKRPGTWATYITVRDSALTPLGRSGADRSTDDWAMAAAFFSPVATAWAALHDVAAVLPGERVLVTGAAGAVGSIAVQLAARHGCEVVAVVGSDSKVAAVPSVATAAIAFERWERDGAIAGGVDAVVDTVGGAPLAAAIRCLRSGGRVALVGYTAGEHVDVPISELLLNDVTLLPTNLLRRGPALAGRGDDWLEALSTGELHLDVHSFDLGEFDQAVAALTSRHVNGRIVLTP